MVDIQQTGPDDQAPEQASSGCATGMKIFGCGCGVLVVAVLILVFVAWQNYRSWTSYFVRMVAVEELDQMGWPPEQKDGFLHQIDRILKAYKDKTVDFEDIEPILEKVSSAPFSAISLASTIDQKYIRTSGLPDQEKTAGSRSLQRFARGVVEKSIGEGDVEQVSAMVNEEVKNAEGQYEQKLKAEMTDEELRAVLAAAKTRADAAEVPDEAYEVDPVAEFKGIIDEVLGPEEPEPAEAEE